MQERSNAAFSCAFATHYSIKLQLIETKMEQFKICEKETKTKAYSKEGLAKKEKIDPEQVCAFCRYQPLSSCLVKAARDACVSWIQESIDSLRAEVDEAEAEIEAAGSSKKKKGKRRGGNDVDVRLLLRRCAKARIFRHQCSLLCLHTMLPSVCLSAGRINRGFDEPYVAY